jgi:Putative abortive phage resistance protein AbiGi, antitoxin
MNHSNFPPLSTNTLFHFTKSLENIIDILTNEFRPHFSLEDFNLLRGKKLPSEEWERGIPMVCFCDIPLSQTRFHLSVYGDYGIGMTKSWGIKHGIAPVLYAYSESLFTSKFTTILQGVLKGDLRKQLKDDLFDLICFVKPYEGDLWREGGKFSNIRFYDEREWRFVPTIPDDFYRTGIPKADFLKETLRREANSRLAKLSRIRFDPNDIKYLIVRREDEIVPLIKEVERIKGKKYSYDDVRLLSSRVISSEQIKSDF